MQAQVIERYGWGIGPSRVELQVSVSSRADQPHEGRLDTCRTCGEVAKGRLALPCPTGHDVLSAARLLFPPLGRVVWSFSAPGRSRTATARRRVGYSHLGSPMPSRRIMGCSVAREGVEPTPTRF